MRAHICNRIAQAFGARCVQKDNLRLSSVLKSRIGALCLAALIAFGSAAEDKSPPGDARVLYENYRRPEVPLSIHVVRVPRHNSKFEIHTLHARDAAVGLAPLSQHLKLSDPAVGAPIAAINGDFYERGGTYAGDPRGLQILDGELISGPSGTATFWIDASGEPHTTNTSSLFQLTWPDGRTAPIELNGFRRSDMIQLYTPAVGSSTRTSGGREFVLESSGAGPWLPLHAERTFKARVREVRETGDSRLTPQTMVLSIGPAQARRIPRIAAGGELLISTMISPSFRGVKTAISGGPILVQSGRIQRNWMSSSSESYEYSSAYERHPRSAIGWNEDYFFLVEVDGRRRNLSMGMTLQELSTYLVKLGCTGAMNFDGGGSATLWYAGQVQNRPCDGYERSIANSLVVLSKVEKTAKAESGSGQPALKGRDDN